MKAIILAAGLGTRLRPITESKAKCMVKVAGKPILQHQIEAYLASEVDEIIVVAGHMGDLVEYFCSRFDKVTVVRNPDYATTNNMYSLGLALDLCDYKDGFILSNGDCVYDHSIVKEIVDNAASAIAVDAGSYALESMKVVVHDGRVVDISKQISPEEAFGNSIDLYKFSKDSAAAFVKMVRTCLESSSSEWTEVALQRALTYGGVEMQALNIAGKKWVEIDSYDDLGIADVLFSTVKEIVKNAEAWFVDLDGTLYLGDSRIDGADKFIDALKEKAPFFLYSNNSSKDKKQYVNKLMQHGIDVSEEHILLSTDGLVHFLKAKGVGTAYVLGTSALSKWMEREGFVLCDKNPDCVVVGYDTELTYAKLQKAVELIHMGVPYYATHPDVVCPTDKGPIPDIGAIVALLKTTTGVDPIKVFGKPNRSMVEGIIIDHGWNPENVVFVGDRTYTDQVMASNVGAKFILVLSGETQREEVEAVETPDVIAPSVRSLTAELRS